jgi:Icc protein
MKLAWLTDLHLNFCAEMVIDDLSARVRSSGAQAAVVTGDIAEADDVVQRLGRLRSDWQLPIYFVLGNHDYYGDAIERVRDRVAAVCDAADGLTYLTRSGPISLTPDCTLIGHDGWADGRAGDFANSTVMLNDYRLIDDLRTSNSAELARRLAVLGDQAADHLQRQFEEIDARGERPAHIVIATHVPPFVEACWHEGHNADDNWAPHFVCDAVGKMLLEIADERAQQQRPAQLTVLCGHCHSQGVHAPRPNLTVRTAGAEYRRPHIDRIIDTAATTEE